MSVDTEIQGKPGAVESAADWLTRKLAVEVGAAADRMNDAPPERDGLVELHR